MEDVREKADEIYEKHLDAMVEGSTHWLTNARNTAIIEVEGIIAENHYTDNNHDLPVKAVDVLSRRLEFWESVKEKLKGKA